MFVAKLMSVTVGLYVLLGLVYCYDDYQNSSLQSPTDHPTRIVGEAVDHFNGVAVYYNGNVSHVSGRNTTADGYNLGLRYQCVEFVKRYYYEHLQHQMPNSYGHAKYFFDKRLTDGARNPDRALIQYRNPSQVKPQVNDLVVFDGTLGNQYGHVAIISAVKDQHIEIVQQNPGPQGQSRATLSLSHEHGTWEIKSATLLGWLRKAP